MAAVFEYKLIASSGYEAEGSYDNVTPNQYRQVVAALNGTLREVVGRLPRAVGVSRMADNPQAVLLMLDREPTDEELRTLHAALGRNG